MIDATAATCVSSITARAASGGMMSDVSLAKRMGAGADDERVLLARRYEPLETVAEVLASADRVAPSVGG
jgi:hypothetical protein